MRRLILSILLSTLFASVAFATSQDPDVLIYDGKTYDLYSNPLESFYGKDWKPAFWVAPNSVSSGNWRGYVATWEIINDKLYLTKIDSWFCNRRIKTKSGCRKVTLHDLFSAKVNDGRVAATWFSNELRVPDGKQLKYVHSGYASIYERDIIFDVDAGKIVKQDVLEALNNPGRKPGAELFTRNSHPEKMSNLRKTISRRLVEAKNTTAMLTTFNEVDMSAIMDTRAKNKDKFKEAYGVNLGFMSFFTKACCFALQEWPAVNAMIDGENIIYND